MGAVQIEQSGTAAGSDGDGRTFRRMDRLLRARAAAGNDHRSSDHLSSQRSDHLRRADGIKPSITISLDAGMGSPVTFPMAIGYGLLCRYPATSYSETPSGQ